MAEVSSQFMSEGGESGGGALLRRLCSGGLRVVLPVVPVGLLYFLDLTPFWGGLVFFVMAELMRWARTVPCMTLCQTDKTLRPLVEMGAIAIAPLFSLSILLLLTASLLDEAVQTELIHSFVLYGCYLPYAILSLFIFPRIDSRG